MFSVTIREKSGQVYTFHFDKPEITLGRIKGNDIILPKQNISKQHARIRVHGARFIVEDFNSTNGTYVNGHKVTQAVEVNTDDKVYVGDFVITLAQVGGAVAGQKQPPAPPSDAIAGESAKVQDAGQLAAQPGLRQTVAMKSIELMPDGSMRIGGQAMQSPAGAGSVPPPPLPPQAPPVPVDVSSTLPVEMPMDIPIDLPADIPLEIPIEIPMDFAPPAPASGPQTAGTEKAARAVRHMATTHEPYDSSPVPESAAPAPASSSAPIPVQSHAGQTGQGTASQPTPVALGASPSSPVPAPEPVKSARVDVPAPTADHWEALGHLYTRASAEILPGFSMDPESMTDDAWASLEEKIAALVDGAQESTEIAKALDGRDLKRDLFYELSGLGPLELLLDDESIESVEVNSFERIFVVQDGRRHASRYRFSCAAALVAVGERLLRALGTTGDPPAFAEGSLDDGTSFRLVAAPLCPTGPAILLRKPTRKATDLDTLVASGLLTADVAATLRHAAAEHRSIAICGKPNSDRRALVNALARLSAPSERIVVVEDGSRLSLDQTDIVRIDRSAYIDRALDLFGVVRSLASDRTVIADLLGGELASFGRVCGDGLGCWLVGLHARTPDELVDRFVAASMASRQGVPVELVRSQVASMLDVVVLLGRAPSGATRVVDVVQVELRDGRVTLEPLALGA